MLERSDTANMDIDRVEKKVNRLVMAIRDALESGRVATEARIAEAKEKSLERENIFTQENVMV